MKEDQPETEKKKSGEQDIKKGKVLHLSNTAQRARWMKSDDLYSGHRNKKTDDLGRRILAKERGAEISMH